MTKPMGYSKRRSKKEVYSDTILPQEKGKTSNRQPNFTRKTTGKRRTKKKNPKLGKGEIKYRADINET